MTIEDYIADALDIVTDRQVPEEDFAQVVNEQARLMAGINLEFSTNIPATSPYIPLSF
jgi:hypothetical protein